MSIQFEVKRTFHVPPQQAYAGLIDLDAARNWMQGLVEIKRLDDGPVRPGSQWKETRKMFGKEATEHFEVVELNEPEKIMLSCDGTKGTTGKGEFLFSYFLEPTVDGTVVTLHGEINGLTGLTKLFGKMMSKTFKNACAKDMDALKNHLEREQPVSHQNN